MSADNAIVIARLDDLYVVYMGFASDDYAMMNGELVRCWTTKEEALQDAIKRFESEAIVEYGIVDLTSEYINLTEEE